MKGVDRVELPVTHEVAGSSPVVPASFPSHWKQGGNRLGVFVWRRGGTGKFAGSRTLTP